MKISILAVGSIGDDRVRGLCDEYRSRLSHHLSVETNEVDKARGSNPRQVMDKEGQRLESATPQGALTIALSEEGKTLTSRQVAENLNRWMVGGRKHVAFYVGGAHGLDRGLRRNADRIWSLSAMTFPHNIARMLLWEQLYRAMTIIRGEPYHK